MSMHNPRLDVTSILMILFRTPPVPSYFSYFSTFFFAGAAGQALGGAGGAGFVRIGISRFVLML